MCGRYPGTIPIPNGHKRQFGYDGYFVTALATATGQSQRLCSVWESLAGAISGFLPTSQVLLYPRIVQYVIVPGTVPVPPITGSGIVSNNTAL